MHTRDWVRAVMGLFCTGVSALAAIELPRADSEEARRDAGLVCDAPVVHFAEARVGAVLTNTFILRNTGTNTVTILNVRPTCGCTTAELSTNRLPAGASVSLTTVLSLAGARGNQRKAVYVESDDSRYPHLKLELTGTVVADIAVEPAGLHFGALGLTGKVQRDVVLTARSNLTFAVKGINTGSTLFKAEVEPRDPGRCYVVHITCDEPRSPGTVSAIVQVVTDCAEAPSVTIPVSAFVAGDLVAVPSQLILVASMTNDVRTAHLVVYSPSGKAFTVKSVQTAANCVTTRVTTATADRVAIEVQSRGGLEDVEGKAIRITTDVPTARELVVPLRVMRPPALKGSR